MSLHRTLTASTTARVPAAPPGVVVGAAVAVNRNDCSPGIPAGVVSWVPTGIAEVICAALISVRRKRSTACTGPLSRTAFVMLPSGDTPFAPPFPSLVGAAVG